MIVVQGLQQRKRKLQRLLESCGGQKRRVVLLNLDRERMPVTASVEITATGGMNNIAKRYRLKALASEQFSLKTTDPAIRAAWVEIAIEWHALSNRAAQEYDEGSVEAG
jgi:hypothetical protein